MPISKEYILKAREELEKRRSANRRSEDKRRAEINAVIPQYADLEIKLAESMSKVIALVAAKCPDCQNKLKAVSEENLALQREMKRLLTEKGFPADYLEPIYSCKKCSDTGIINGEWCDCVKKIARKYAADELNERSPLKLCSFADFDLSLYPDKPASEDNPRRIMTDNFNFCLKYAEEFSGHGKGVFMIGKTGLGKTHLSLAIAARVIEQDFCAVYISAPELVRTVDNEQFGRSSGDTLSVIADCDLLILDDLGAENSNERSASLLYEVINGRISRSLPIIVSTNYSINELHTHYNDRILSRLFSMNVRFFEGNDNRLNKIR